jgi:hypothetical protein
MKNATQKDKLIKAKLRSLSKNKKQNKKAATLIKTLSLNQNSFYADIRDFTMSPFFRYADRGKSKLDQWPKQNDDAINYKFDQNLQDFNNVKLYCSLCLKKINMDNDSFLFDEKNNIRHIDC